MKNTAVNGSPPGELYSVQGLKICDKTTSFGEGGDSKLGNLGPCSYANLLRAFITMSSPSFHQPLWLTLINLPARAEIYYPFPCVKVKREKPSRSSKISGKKLGGKNSTEQDAR
jgi:hypothetical protein